MTESQRPPEVPKLPEAVVAAMNDEEVRLVKALLDEDLEPADVVRQLIGDATED